MHVAWGDCSFDGTNTNCHVSGTFTGLGPGGTYDFLLSYPGNGPTPLTAISRSPGNDLIFFSLSSGSLTVSFKESNGTTVSFADLNFEVFFVPVATTCTGSVTSCGPGSVGLTPGATETGPVNGTFDPTPVIRAVITAGAYGGFASIAPATWIEIYGLNLATTTGEWGGADFHGNNAPTSLGGTTASIDGKPAFVRYVSPGQVNVQVPSDVGTGSQPAIVTTVGGSSVPFSVNVNSLEPGLLAPPVFDIKGTQYAVALFPDGVTYVLPGAVAGVPTRVAKPGDTIILYGIGFGPVTPDNPAGVIVQGISKVNASFDISFAGKSAQVRYDGLTVGFLGLYQFNVVVPDVAASDAVPVTFKLAGTGGSQTLFLPVGN